ncbi:hypothetical protein AXF42_Ash006669 [Apostasia shenzhenica]|uniref:Uncharacterized protein n=1 Tax=Apostasia shenzhenica TaxID=1088818 RepID=A0A2I0AIT7_9ASPA|nr:hypothetical protein AXF42_Ash006669 [Apostasia shenzhenica]
MEVVVPVQDFHFDSALTSPYVSVPSSPKRFGGNLFDVCYHYTSAPNSPTAASAIYKSFRDTAAASGGGSCRLSVPFDWEEKPGTPKFHIAGDAGDDDDDDFDFAFDFSGQLEKGAPPPELTAADELFEQGKIRPLKAPPLLHVPVAERRSGGNISPRSPKSPANSGRRRVGKDFDSFARERGRDRTPCSPSMTCSRSRKGSRSLSPLRSAPHHAHPPMANTMCSGKDGNVGDSGSRRWRLKDLLLFRSASEGRATGDKNRDPLQKLTISPPSCSSSLSSPKIKGLCGEDSRNTSFRSVDGGRSARRGSGSGTASPHEKHYTENRAAEKERKKKTALPYRQGFFSFFRIAPASSSRAAKGLAGESSDRRRF